MENVEDICPRLWMGPVSKQPSPDSKVHGANMGPIWGRQDPVGPHVDPINFAIWEVSHLSLEIHNIYKKYANGFVDINDSQWF